MNTLTSTRIELRPAGAVDMPTLFRWRNEATYLKMFSAKRTLVNEAEFALEHKKALERERHLQCMIVRRATNEVVGTAFTFNLNLVDGYVFLNAYVDAQWRNRGYGPEAAILLTTYMFAHYPIFKVCYEAFGYNRPSISVMKTAGLVQEGVFRGHRFFDGERHDVFRFAVYRDALDRVQDLEKRFKNPSRGCKTRSV